MAHVALVAPRYHVGSFDDDSAYLYMAQSIAHGTSLFGRLPNSFPVVDAYPPGYSYLLAPLVAVFGAGHGFWPERALSVLCYGALFPLTWSFLRRRGTDEITRLSVLGLLAINPLLGTYGSMVMAEMPYLLVFLALLFAAERWVASARTFSAAGVATVVLAAGAVWLKEAGLAMAGGMVLWLFWSKRWRKAFAAAAGCGLLLAPVAVARLVNGVPLAGARYASEIGSYYSGGLLHKAVLLPLGALEFVFYALYAAVTPVDSPLSNHLGVLIVVGGLASAAAAVFCVVGAAVWWRRRGADVVLFVVGAYALECMAYRYVNERRVLLFLPVAAAWYVMGARATGRWVLGTARRRRWAEPAVWHRRFAAAGFAGVLVLLVQLPTDYVVRLGESTSRPAGSPYMALLARLGHPRSVVETDYVWTTALYSGHPGMTSAFQATYNDCSPALALAGLREDHAAFGYTAAFFPPAVDDPCLAALAATQPWAVTLLHTSWDDATVFEVLGPGTVHPDLRKLATSLSATAPAGGGSADAEWSLPPSSTVTQVSLGGAHSLGGRTGSVTVALQVGGAWRTVASRRGPVGAAGSVNPFLLTRLPAGVHADAVRVTVTGSGPARLSDLAVLGRTG